MGDPRKDPFERAERRESFLLLNHPPVCVHHQFERGRSRHLFVEEPVALHDVAISWQVRIQLSSTRRRVVATAHAATRRAQTATRRGLAQPVSKRSADVAGRPPRAV